MDGVPEKTLVLGAHHIPDTPFRAWRARTVADFEMVLMFISLSASSRVLECAVCTLSLSASPPRKPKQLGVDRGDSSLTVVECFFGGHLICPAAGSGWRCLFFVLFCSGSTVAVVWVPPCSSSYSYIPREAPHFGHQAHPNACLNYRSSPP